MKGMSVKNVEKISMKARDVLAVENLKVYRGIIRGFAKAKVLVDVSNLLILGFWYP